MQQLTGTIERITFYNEENGYAVLKIMPDQRRIDAARDGTVTVVGIMPEINVGEALEFTGQWVEDKQYGRQFRAETVSTLLPTSLIGITNYLGSGLVKGIGIATAEKIVNHFGVETLDILERDPERLYDVPGLKKSLADKLKNTWAHTQAARQAMIYLQGYGVSSKLATRIYNEYRSETVNKVQADPYTLADDVFGIGFIKADAIAQNMGLEPDNHGRIRAGLNYALNQSANDGHVYIPRDTLLTTCAELLKIDNPLRIKLVLDTQIRNRELISDPAISQEPNTAIYLPMYYRAETHAAMRLHTINAQKSALAQKAHKTDWQKLLARLMKQAQISLTDQQQSAVQAALSHKISVLTGGPGTGKTTTLQTVIGALSDLKFKFALASPTGRGSKGLAESTGHPASTIHRLLGYNPIDGFLYDESNPLAIDMLIIDETSMVDQILFYHLLKALKPETHLMLVGDINQLPSVGAGNILHDVINSKIAHVTQLDNIFRQGKDSHIIVNAHRINHGELPFMDNKSDDFFFFGSDDPYKCAELVIDIVTKRLPRKFGCDTRDIQVLSPMYRGPAGVDALNNALQEAINPKNPAKRERIIGERALRQGDKVIQTKNNYDKDVFNGDSGRVYSFNFDDGEMRVMMDDGRIVVYNWQEATEQLRLSYCISTHRSQGSEYPFVVIPILTQHYMMLQRNLLYTAITRAKQAVVLVGSRRAVATAVDNNRVAERYTGLLARLQNAQLANDDEL